MPATTIKPKRIATSASTSEGAGIPTGQAIMNALQGMVITTDPRLSDARTPTTHVHAPADVTGTAVVTNDSRLTDARTPTTHGSEKHSASYEAANANIQTHVTSAHAPSNAQKNSDITKAEIEAKLTGVISSHSHVGQEIGLVTLANDTLAQALATNINTKLTVTANRTLTTTIPAAGKRCSVLILTSGTTSYVVTFGTGFKPTATLATGTTSARIFVVSFISDGTNLYEFSRTIAMVA
jgi:hypothetical protein